MPWSPKMKRRSNGIPAQRASSKPQQIGSEAWMAQVVKATATEPVKRTTLQHRVIFEARALWDAEDATRSTTTPTH